jgi:hypothetical protein
MHRQIVSLIIDIYFILVYLIQQHFMNSFVPRHQKFDSHTPVKFDEGPV